MTGPDQERRVTGSGSGHPRQVSLPGENTPSRTAYRTLLEHGSTCAACRANQRCEPGRALHRAWRDVREGARGSRGSTRA